MSSSRPSLHFAKRQQLVNLHDVIRLWGSSVKLIQWKHDKGSVLCKMSCDFIDAKSPSSVRTAVLMAESLDGKLHYAAVTLPAAVFSEWSSWSRRSSKRDTVHLSMLPMEWTAHVLDDLCKMSDTGVKLVYVKKSAKRGVKSEVSVFLDSYHGAKVQIEAELAAPEFAYLDEIVEVPF